MDLTSGIVIVLVAAIASVGSVVAVYLLLRNYFNHQIASHEKEWKERKRKDYLPIQMQAYERMILFLERINPERLVFRVNKPGMSGRYLLSEILKVVRDEFDHNLTQQLYISPQAWEALKAAREETVKILNAAHARIDKDADSMALSRSILEVAAGLEKLPTEVAISILKKEFLKKLNP